MYMLDLILIQKKEGCYKANQLLRNAGFLDFVHRPEF
jgi:hypothetical protein